MKPKTKKKAKPGMKVVIYDANGGGREVGAPKPENTHKFCRKCGTALITSVVGAETYVTYSWGDKYHPYYAYSEKDGTRQTMKRWSCPNKSLFACHDDFIVDEILKIVTP